ncbi:hypothetical protein GJ744_002716 [Endocarpon pusillum]|uniref:Uncharacterized protein n=1 Tax=Endocarpon pusillum TaxID=364733 RepID=A0A8H7AMR4_9EURO|nr:hypothetical protein GJ744_002716 [Endocarpon pusillum]
MGQSLTKFILSHTTSNNHQHLTTAGKAGIGVGVGVAGTIVISSFIYQNKKRRGRQQLQQQKSEMVSNPLTVRREGKRSDGIL